MNVAVITDVSKAAFDCPHCAANGTVWAVKDSRQSNSPELGTNYRRRRRQCSECQNRITTMEIDSGQLFGVLQELTTLRLAQKSLRQLLRTDKAAQ